MMSHNVRRHLLHDLKERRMEMCIGVPCTKNETRCHYHLQSYRLTMRLYRVEYQSELERYLHLMTNSILNTEIHDLLQRHMLATQ